MLSIKNKFSDMIDQRNKYSFHKSKAFETVSKKN